MNYSQARSLIKSGDVILYRGKTALSRLICHVTGGSWSHVGIAYWVQDRLFIFQQEEFKNCNLQLLSETMPFDWIALNLTVPPDFEHWMYSQLNHPYSYWDAFLIGIGIKGESKTGTCSQLVKTCLYLMGKYYNVQSPSDIADALDADGYSITPIKNKP